MFLAFQVSVRRPWKRTITNAAIKHVLTITVYSYTVRGDLWAGADLHITLDLGDDDDQERLDTHLAAKGLGLPDVLAVAGSSVARRAALVARTRRTMK